MTRFTFLKHFRSVLQICSLKTFVCRNRLASFSFYLILFENSYYEEKSIAAFSCSSNMIQPHDHMVGLLCIACSASVLTKVASRSDDPQPRLHVT